MHAAGSRHAGADVAIKNANPSEGQAQVLRGAEQHVRFDFQFFQVDIGLIEAVEQNQAIGADLIEALCKIGQVAEKRTQLGRNRNVNRSLYFAEYVGIVRFQLGAKNLGVRRNRVDVALDCVSPGLLNVLGVLCPTAESGAVEAGDDGNVDGGFGFANVLQILLGSGVEFAGMRKVSDGLGEALVPALRWSSSSRASLCSCSSKRE